MFHHIFAANVRLKIPWKDNINNDATLKMREFGHLYGHSRREVAIIIVVSKLSKT